MARSQRIATELRYIAAGNAGMITEMHMHAQRGPLKPKCSAFPRGAACLVLLAGMALLTACSSGANINLGNSTAGDPATVDFPIFYVKRPVPLDQAGNFRQ